MMTHTIREYDPVAFDKACNEFSATHTVKFSQTHYCREYDKKELEVFVMISWYEGELVKPVQKDLLG